MNIAHVHLFTFATAFPYEDEREFINCMCFVLVYRFPENGDHHANINPRKNFEHQWHTLKAQDPLPNTFTIYTNG